MDEPIRPRFFRTRAAFRAWLARSHARRAELCVGFRKKGSGLPGITYPEALDEALCFGWIDAIRRSFDATGYMIRFCRRKPQSGWSAVNVRHVERLMREGRMEPAGLAVFAARDAKRTAAHSHERANARLEAAYERRLRANPRAWAFFQARPPSYRRLAIWWVMSAKREETRQRRLTALIEDSAAGRDVKPLRRPGGAMSRLDR
jgi:uncharacterized protein YdeI (YjbR/CyaY-like superfamily)